MKKSLLALSLAAALSGSAFAADVQVYGLIDLSLSYVHSDSDGWGSDSKFTMENAREFGSRFGIKGSEVGADGLFRAIDPLFANYTEAFGSGYVSASSWTRVDNAISYVSPTFAGFTGYAMYSFKNSASSNATEGTSESDRYASLAVRYLGGPLEVVMVADTTIYGNARSGNQNSDDGWTATLGGNYTLSNGLKLIAFGQYFKNMDLNAQQRAGVVRDGLVAGAKAVNAALGSNVLEEDYGFVDGYGLSIGANYPLFGGVIKGQLAYRDMDSLLMALQCYEEAAMAADTAAADCDYATLSRIYGQSAELFSRLWMPHNVLKSCRLSYKYAMAAKDTLTALMAYGFSSEAYNLLNDTLNDIKISENASKFLKKHGYNKASATYL